MNWYFIILCGLGFMGLGRDLALHDKEEIKTHNFWISLFAFVLNVWLIFKAVECGF